MFVRQILTASSIFFLNDRLVPGVYEANNVSSPFFLSHILLLVLLLLLFYIYIYINFRRGWGEVGLGWGWSTFFSPLCKNRGA